MYKRQVLGYECWWDLPALPKIDLDEPHAREHILEVAERWVRFGIDGWRLDVAEEIGADFWREFHQRVRAVDPEAYIVGEVWVHKPEWLQGDMFDAFMNYPLTVAIMGFAAQEHLDPEVPVPFEYIGQLQAFSGAELWARVQELESVNPPEVTAVQLNLLGSHDTPRIRTFCGGDLDAVRLAMLLQMTLPGAPCIYYGDEIGMDGSDDPGCRRAFPADPTEWEREPYPWLADLVALRHSSLAFRDAESSLLAAEGPAIAYLRREGSDAFVVVVNAGNASVTLELPLGVEASAAEVVPLRGGAVDGRTAVLDGGVLRVSLAGRDGMVARLTT